MKRNIPLTEEQQMLVKNHLYIVTLVITESIHVNKNIYGFEYEDLYQEGCIWLCHAAATYNSSCMLFSTYSKRVVRNGLLSYCRLMCARQRHFSPLVIDEYGDFAVDGALLQQTDNFNARISIIETLDLLTSVEKNYQGVARLGIKALKLKISGMSTFDIAQLYDVPSSHVSAWISRAACKLRNNRKFLSSIL